jgi:4-amino-4-deoxy-L-arabinose transferase-like glycosyltransferase
MKSSSQETFAQVMFWTGMGCFPLSLFLISFGARAKEVWQAAKFFLLAAITLTHFVWYLKVFSGALTTWKGPYEPPAWYSFLPFTVVIFVILTGVWIAHDRRQKRVAQTPPLPRE